MLGEINDLVRSSWFFEKISKDRQNFTRFIKRKGKKNL